MKPIGYDSGRQTYSKIQIEVTNQTAKDMMNVAFVLDRDTENERTLRADHQLHSGRTFGTSISATEAGLNLLKGDDATARKIINEQLVARVALLFEIDGECFAREGDVVKSQKASK